MKNACPNCKYYKMAPRRAKPLAAAFLISALGWWVSLFPFGANVVIGYFMIAVGIAIALGSILITGEICTNCGRTTDL